jgi:ATP/maltotriose-dependent transcriptional regulator MalT
VLGTKLHVPAARRPLVARPRLTELVRSGSELPRLVLISAPAGFGKTTLLSQWLSPTRPNFGDADATASFVPGSAPCPRAKFGPGRC